MIANKFFQDLSPSEEEKLSGGGVTVEPKPENVSGITLNFDTNFSPQIVVKKTSSLTIIDLNVGGVSQLPGSVFWDSRHPQAAPNPGQAGAPLAPVGPGSRP